jgi:RNA-directed DNA polymerase
VILVFGEEQHVHAIREDVAHVLAPIGLRLSPAKTSVVHMSDGFDFLGFRLQWRRKRGTSKWYVYTFIAQRPVRSLKAKIRALTRRTSQQDLGYVLTRLNQVCTAGLTTSGTPSQNTPSACWITSPGGG